MQPEAMNRREPPLIPMWNPPQALSDDGVIDPHSYKTDWTTTGAAAASMGDGEFDGQVKLIQMVADLGDGVLTPRSLLNGTTITFADVGDCALMVWSTSRGAWIVLDLYNRADGATAPVVA